MENILNYPKSHLKIKGKVKGNKVFFTCILSCVYNGIIKGEGGGKGQITI